MSASNLWSLFFVPFVLISLKQFLLWFYLWQKKEYRGDKMWDYFSLEESKNIVFDKWTNIRIIYLSIFLLFSVVAIFYWDSRLLQLFAIMTLLLLFLTIIESLEFVFKLFLKKTILKPSISAKMALHSFLNILTIGFLYGTFLTNNFALNVMLSVILILLIPIIIGYWLLVLLPIDYYFKSQLFLKTKKYRQGLNGLKVIAVSGAYGKTTTKDILEQLLSTKFNVEKTLKNQNSNVSCARKTLNLKSETDIFICELGSYKTGDGNEISDFILPNCSIITGLNFQHYSLFGSEKNIILAESESLKFLPKNSPVAINWSSSMCRKIELPKNVKLIKYGIIQNNSEAKDFDIYAKNIKLTKDLTTEFELVYKDKTEKLSTNLLSMGNIENLVGGIALALHYKISMKAIKAKLTELIPPHGALETSKQKNYYKIDDSYNANFDGVKNAIELLTKIKENKSLKVSKSVLFIDDILELGQKSIPTHKELGDIIVKNKIDLVILLGRNFAGQIYHTLSEESFDMDNIWFWDSKNTMFIKSDLQNYLETNPNSVVLFEGYQSRKFLLD